MNDLTSLRVLVVGGGIGGLAAALALRRAGMVPELVEARPAWPATGAAITLHGNGVRALRALGVGAALDAAGEALPAWSFHDASGDLLCRTDLRSLWDGVGPCLGVTRRRLHEVLAAAAGDVRCRLGTAVTSVRPGTEHVTAGFDDGSGGEYDLIVAADGVRSTVRRLVLGPARPERLPVLGWRSLAPVRPQGVTGVTLLLGSGRFFGLVPVGDGMTYGFAGTSDGPAVLAAQADRVGALRRLFAEFGGPVPAYLAALSPGTEVHVTPIEWVPAPRWVAGRVVLVGDAAHASPPHLGQGGSLAVEDALVLADELRRAVSAAGTVPAALVKYEARRRPRVAWVQARSTEAALAWAAPPEVRDATLRRSGDPQLQQRYAPLREPP